jgi:tetratricopeptide (TPR) repeat protein
MNNVLRKKVVSFFITLALASASAIAQDTTYLASSDSANEFAARGEVFFGQGLFEQSIEQYTEALRRSKRYEFYVERGRVYNENGQYRLAMDDFNSAISLNATLSPAFSGRALSNYFMEDYITAIADFSEAIRLNPQDSISYLNRGLVRYQLESYEQAVQDFTACIGLDPGLADAWYDRGLSYYRLGRLDEARADFDRVLELDSTHSYTLLMLKLMGDTPDDTDGGI